jgi:hypothetical protein
MPSRRFLWRFGTAQFRIKRSRQFILSKVVSSLGATVANEHGPKSALSAAKA